MGPAEIRYARNGDVSIAYQVLDRGSTELKGVPGEWRLYALAEA